MKKFLLILFVLFAAFISGGLIVWNWKNYIYSVPFQTVTSTHPIITKTINGKTLNIEVVSTPEDRKRGLSGRSSMPLDQGMLFVFDKPGVYAFWMKDMHFPLDMLWINDGVVVDMAKNMPAPQATDIAPATYRPKFTADRVLELNARQAEAYGLTVGAKIPID